MSTKLPTNPSRTVGNSRTSSLADIPCKQAKAGIDGNSDARLAFLVLIRQAARDVNLSQKEFALNAGCPESHLSEGLNGVRPMQALWLWLQPDRFLLRLVELLMDARHLTPESVRAIRAARIKELIGLLLEEAA
jgi:hypothetical protein